MALLWIELPTVLKAAWWLLRSFRARCTLQIFSGTDSALFVVSSLDTLERCIRRFFTRAAVNGKG